MFSASYPSRMASRRSQRAPARRAAMVHPGVEHRHRVHKGRGATFNPANRYESTAIDTFDDGWSVDPAQDAPQLLTRVTSQRAKTIVSTNNSPDIAFDLSLNPYMGCEHGCIYCYARPTHAYLGMSPGLDFETRIIAKPNAAELLHNKLSSATYVPKVIAIGANTDPYQPVERQERITRGVLEVMAQFNQPFTIITKSQGVLRDLDILEPMGRAGLCRVMVSITSLDAELSRLMEPRATHPEGRFQTVRRLAEAGVAAGVLVAPMIAAINDDQLERIIERAASEGADTAGYVALRLPLEIKELFEGWLQSHFPDRKARVLQLIREMRGGQLYQSEFGTRMRGSGPYAQLLAARFERIVTRLGLNSATPPLDTTKFKVPPRSGQQTSLF